MPLTKPLNNNVLVEVQREDDGVSRADDNASLQFGKIISISTIGYHVTASSFGQFTDKFLDNVLAALKPGVVVRWEEFAEGGQTFKENGKTYALIPWWRLISYEEETK